MYFCDIYQKLNMKTPKSDTWQIYYEYNDDVSFVLSHQNQGDKIVWL